MKKHVDQSEHIIEQEWPYLLSMIQTDLEQSAAQTGALTRKRQIRDAPTLLRLIMAYALCIQSLREVASWASQAKIAQLSWVALFKRFKKCHQWLGLLVAQKLTERTQLRAPELGSLRLRVLDATALSQPGSIGTDFRVHLGMDLSLMQIDRIDLTDVKETENLSRFPVEQGDILLCDRGYVDRKGIWHVIQAKGHLILRIGWRNLPLLDSNGNEFDLLATLRKLKPAQLGDFVVMTCPNSKKKVPSIPGRIIAIRKSPEQIEQSRRRLNRYASKKGHTLDERTLEFGDYIFLFTTLSRRFLCGSDILELYRFRWQIETIFKRMKSLLQLDELSAKDKDFCKTFILAKLLGVLLVEDLSRKSGSFSPWGYGSASPNFLVAPIPKPS